MSTSLVYPTTTSVHSQRDIRITLVPFLSPARSPFRVQTGECLTSYLVTPTHFCVHTTFHHPEIRTLHSCPKSEKGFYLGLTWLKIIVSNDSNDKEFHALCIEILNGEFPGSRKTPDER